MTFSNMHQKFSCNFQNYHINNNNKTQKAFDTSILLKILIHFPK